MTSAPIALPVLGVDRIGRFNFLYNEGGAAYEKALGAAKKKDWGAVRAACELAVARDPFHLDARRLLAIALTQQGEPAAAVDHIVAAIAGDYWKYGAAYATDPELDDFRRTPHGQAVAALATQIHDEWQKRVKGAIWVIGRRSTFKWPTKDGVQYATSRGELYAYDRDSKRFYRLTHTDHQVAGYVRGARSVAVLGFDKVDHPKDESAPPLIARPYVWLFDPVEWKPLGKKIELPSARAVAIGYGDGDQLIVGEAQATGRWTTGDWAVSTIDQAGKLVKANLGLPKLRVELTLDDARSTHDTAGVEATWINDTAPALKVGTTTIQVLESHAASMDSVALAPDKAHLAFATAVDPCAKDAVPSLYIADTRSGQQKHILTQKSHFATRWLDATTLAYDDGDGAIRLWDTSTGREAAKLEDKAGLALDVLSLAGPVCKTGPAPQTGSAGGSDDALPPEEPAP